MHPDPDIRTRAFRSMYDNYATLVPIDQMAKKWKDIIGIASKLYNNGVCKEAVSPRYAIANLKNKHEFVNNFCMIVLDDSNVPQGVLQANISSVSGYIDVICAFTGFGPSLISEFLRYFDHFFPMNPVSLSAMPNVLAFYQRFCFSFRHSCEQYIVKPFFDEYIKQIKLGNIMDEDAAYNNTEALKILTYLQKYELNVTSQKDKNKVGCKSENRKNLNLLVNERCGNDGYTMYRCPAALYTQDPELSEKYKCPAGATAQIFDQRYDDNDDDTMS